MGFANATTITTKMLINGEDLRAVLDPILPKISAHKVRQHETNSTAPFMLCLSGLQGSGKSTWASCIADSL
jgi:pantothenate kinase-related protein Tda10